MAELECTLCKKQYEVDIEDPEKNRQCDRCYKEVQEKLAKYYNAFNDVLKLLKSLPEWDSACSCDDYGSSDLFYADDGRFGEGMVVRYCCACGGYLTD